MPCLTEHRAAIAQSLAQCRQGTLALVAQLDDTVFRQQAHPDFSPVGWHLGHIAFTESVWILEHLAGQPCPYPQYRRLFAADGLPKAERQNLPDWADIQTFLSRVREQVLDYLAIAPLTSQARLWHWLLQHESQHGETITLLLALHRQQGQSVPLKSPVAVAGEAIVTPGESVYVPAGDWVLGSDRLDAIDNEQPPYTVHLDSYWIDRTPVTCGQYRQFMEAGGYQNPAWWSATGWAWLQSAELDQPLYWLADPAFDCHPVCGVSWYEAAAYARSIGKRLPTEAEWEKAAGWHPETEPRSYPWGNQPPTPAHCNHDHVLGQTSPVAVFPQNVSPVGCHDLLGNVWEWTSSWFTGYPGFEAYPYRGYSQVYFDQAHRVLRGGSWATRPWALRNTFRNWYQPHVRELFMGFRCARSV
jgi:ergothioneine biosynthesis protein EgtB